MPARDPLASPSCFAKDSSYSSRSKVCAFGAMHDSHKEGRAHNQVLLGLSINLQIRCLYSGRGDSPQATHSMQAHLQQCASAHRRAAGASSAAPKPQSRQCVGRHSSRLASSALALGLTPAHSSLPLASALPSRQTRANQRARRPLAVFNQAAEPKMTIAITGGWAMCVTQPSTRGLTGAAPISIGLGLHNTTRSSVHSQAQRA